MTEDLFTSRLSDYLDGELERSEHDSIEQHLASCAHCRATLAELRRVIDRARSLEDRAPAADLWPGIAMRLEPRTEANGSAGPGGLQTFRDAVRRRFSFTLPQLAAAGIALMVLSGGMVWMAQSGNSRADFPAVDAERATVQDDVHAAPAHFADANYDQAITDLELILEGGRSRLDPETVRVLEDNLRAIDQAIDQSRRALANDPANTYLNSHLAKSKQRKLALLRRASGFVSAGS